jgi:hypothetical protein
MTLFGIVVVDTWLVYSKCTGTIEDEKQAEFYTLLAEELIENTYDSALGRRRRSDFVTEDSPTLSRLTGAPRSGVYAHLTPTKRRRRRADGSLTKQRLQGRCMICHKKTTYLCSVCSDNTRFERTPWLCHSEHGRHCFSTHYEDIHQT